MNFLSEVIGQANPSADDPVGVMVMCNEQTAHLCQVPHDYLFRDDARAMVECSLLVWEYFRYDLMVANTDVYNFEAESMGQKLVYFKENMPDIDRNDYLIKSKDDLSKIAFKGLNTGRLPYLIEYCEVMKEYCGFTPTPGLSGPWSVACDIYCMEDLIVDCYEDPDFVKALLNKIVDDYYIPFYESLLERLPECTYWNCGDAFASPPMVNMDIINNIILPAVRKVRTGVKVENFAYDTAGVWGYEGVPKNERENFADYIIEATGALVGMDPDLENIGTEWFCEYALKKNVPLIFGVSSAFLLSASIGEIVERVKDYTIAGMKTGLPFRMFLLNIAEGTPNENIHAAISTARAYGQRGIDHNEVKAELPQRESFEEFIRSKKETNKEGYSYQWLQKSTLNV